MIRRSFAHPPFPGVLCLSFLVLASSSLGGQEPAAAEAGEAEALRVFLDCQTRRGCDDDFLRTEIGFVDWVRERQDADVHVIVTSQGAGGGSEITVDFIGRRPPVADTTDRLTWSSSSTDTESEILEGVTRVVALGLARFSHLAGVGGFQVEVAEDRRERASVQPGEDPWNFWVFEVDAGGSLSGEESRSRRSVNGSISAQRTTEAWNIELEARGRHNRQEFELNDSTTFVDTSRNWSFDVNGVRSVGEHWGVGLVSGLGASTFTNRDLMVRLSPAAEWNFFPYEEATRRRLIAFYQVGLEYNDYEKETILGETEEILFFESLTLSYRAREAWGEAEVGVEGSHFFNDLEELPGWRVQLNSEIEIRLFRGLDLEVEASAGWVRDQVFLSAEGASDEEILVDRRALATDFEYEVQLGLSYTFGSIFNTIVNNRFPEVFQRFRF